MAKYLQCMSLGGSVHRHSLCYLAIVQSFNYFEIIIFEIENVIIIYNLIILK